MRVEGIKALCEVFGCSHQAIAEWQEQGMPVESRGGPNTPSVFETADRLGEGLVHGTLIDEDAQLLQHASAVVGHRQALHALHLGAGSYGAGDAADVGPTAHEVLAERGDVNDGRRGLGCGGTRCAIDSLAHEINGTCAISRGRVVRR